MTLSPSETELVLILVAAQDERRLWRVRADEPGLPGIVARIDYAAPLNKQIRRAAAAAIGLESRSEDLVVHGPLTPVIELDDGRQAALVLVQLTPEQLEAPSSWPTFPVVLRALPKNKSRLPYMKALQILSGALEQGVNAIEIDDQVREALLKQRDRRDD